MSANTRHVLQSRDIFNWYTQQHIVAACGLNSSGRMKYLVLDAFNNRWDVKNTDAEGLTYQVFSTREQDWDGAVQFYNTL